MLGWNVGNKYKKNSLKKGSFGQICTINYWNLKTFPIFGFTKLWKFATKEMLYTIVDINNNSTFSSQYMSPEHHSHHYGTQGRKIMF